MDLPDHALVFHIVQLLRQRIGEQLRRMQRLQQIVADSGEEPGLGVVGAFGLATRGIEQLGAFVHALFERGIDVLQFVLGATERGDIGESGDEATAGHWIAANLDDAAVREHPFRQMQGAGAHVRKTTQERALTVTGDLHPFQRPATQARHWRPDFKQIIRESEQFLITRIPRHKLQVGIDHADALAHVLQRPLQHALVEVEIL